MARRYARCATRKDFCDYLQTIYQDFAKGRKLNNKGALGGARLWQILSFAKG